MRYIKIILLVLLSLGVVYGEEIDKSVNNKILQKPPYDNRLDIDSRALGWYRDAGKDSDSAYNIGLVYQLKLKDYKEAKKWYLYAWSLEKKAEIANNLGITYYFLNDNQKAILWYKKAIKLNDNDSLYNLAYTYEDKLYDYKNAIKYYKLAHKKNVNDSAFNIAKIYKDKLNNYKKAKEWYEISIKKKNIDAVKNLGRLYRYELKDDIKASSYYIAMIGNRYKKDKILDFLRNRWNLSQETIKAGYEAQLKSDIIPESLKYKGGIE